MLPTGQKTRCPCPRVPRVPHAIARGSAAAAAALLSALAPHANAQHPYTDDRPVAEILDQGIADQDPLARSLRTVPNDGRADANFRRLYRLPDGRLVRIAGALHAVMPPIGTDAAGRGNLAIPAGTVFHIGPPPTPGTPGTPGTPINPDAVIAALAPPADAANTPTLARRVSSRQAADQRSNRLDAPAATEPVTPINARQPLRTADAVDAPPPATTITDERYRTARLSLLARAAQTHR